MRGHRNPVVAERQTYACWEAVRLSIPDKFSAYGYCPPDSRAQLKQAHEQMAVTEEQIRTALAEFSALWDELFPAEQSRIIQLLVERVEIQPDRLSIKLCKNGLVSLANELSRKAAA